jgi:hypothetical protein
MMSRIDSWHWKISTGHHFQNGRYNTAQIQHCPISTTFHMWVDYDVPNWLLTSKNFYRLPFSKWLLQYRTNSTLSDFNDISYMGRLWCPELTPDIEKFLPVSIFKMATTIPQKFNIVRFQRYNLGHETWWSYRYMFLVDPKVFRFVVKGVKAIFLGVQRGWGLLWNPMGNLKFRTLMLITSKWIMIET